MKNLTVVYFCLVLFLVFIFSIRILAQDNAPSIHFSIYGGASLPQGDFGSINGDKAGYAKTGFSAMIEGSKILNESVNLTSTISNSINSIDDSEM